MARPLTYGWGVIPAAATIGGTAFSTTLFPKDGGYLLPLKVVVRESVGIRCGDLVEVLLSVGQGA